MPDAAITLPSRRDEDFRYADLGALASLWPVAHDLRIVKSGEPELALLPEEQGYEAVSA